MRETKPTDSSKLFVAGINYRKTDASVRGLFAVGTEQYEHILRSAPVYGVTELLVLSTCNRTEIYGIAEEAELLIRLLCAHTAGSRDTFSELAYIKNDLAAMEHLFQVSAGLDSQILGDYEIVGQIKQSVKLSKKYQGMGAFLERLVNSALQASKSVKNETALSDGTVSVSFAAVQYIKEKISRAADKKILLLGTGKIGRSTCKNLVDYLGANNITLINRTDDKASDLANDVQVGYAPFKELAGHVRSSDIIVVATHAPTPILLRSDLEHAGHTLVIDLSIPCNVDPSVQDLSHIRLVNVDELSKRKDRTLQKREGEVPKAMAIIASHLSVFLEWQEMRKQVPVLRAVKTKLKQLNDCPIFIRALDSKTHKSHQLHSEEKIQRVINGMATKMRQQNQRGCHYIEAINEFIATGTN